MTNNNWLSFFEYYIEQNPHATDEDLFSRFKELKGNSKLIRVAWAHSIAKSNPNVTQKMLERMYPEFYPGNIFKRFLRLWKKRI